jgi:hypothetical protein
VLQTVVEAFFVSPSSDHIVAVAPKAELRPYMQKRLYVQRKPTGWAINPDGQADYESPDDWSITFTEVSEVSANVGVEVARSEGFERVIPTPIVRRWAPYSIERSSHRDQTSNAHV